MTSTVNKERHAIQEENENERECSVEQSDDNQDHADDDKGSVNGVTDNRSYGSREHSEERDVFPDMYDTSDAGDTHSLSECRSMSEERSVTPDDLDEIEHVLMEQPKPKVIVFDLDYTLWPFWVDRGINIELPVKQVGEHKVCDAAGRTLKSFPDVTAILHRLHSEGYKLGIASEAMYKDECARLVKLFGWDEFFDYNEIYPGSKIFHFVKIKRASGIDFCDMLYFDDEKEHLAEVAGTCTGITTCWADRGVSDELIEEAFLTFAKNRESSTYFRSKPVTISRRNSTEPFVSLRPLVNLRRRNSMEAENVLPPAHTILGGASLAALADGLSLKEKIQHHGFNPNLPGLEGSVSGSSQHRFNPNLPGLNGSSSTHRFNPNLPGLNGPIEGPARSKTRRRFSIM